MFHHLATYTRFFQKMLRDQLKNIPANGLTPACLYSLDVSSWILSLKEKKTQKYQNELYLLLFSGKGGGGIIKKNKKKKKKRKALISYNRECVDSPDYRHIFVEWL